jgi:drug/metabolite transporter (DMT)-like permease
MRTGLFLREVRPCAKEAVIRQSSLARVLVLTGATAVWGSTFVVTKGTLTGMAATGFLAWRFGIAAVVLALVWPDRLRAMTADDVRRGALLGIFLATAFLLQTTGLRDISAASSGFLTGTMVVLTPLVAAAVFRERVTAAGWIAVLMAMCGIALLMLPGLTMGLGAVLTVGGAVCFATHIAGLSRWATSANAYGLTALSVLVAAGLSACAAMVTGGLDLPPTPSAWRSLLYLAVVATCVGFGVQAWAQSGLSATAAAVVMTLEPVFAAALAAGVGGERLSAVAVAGGLIVVASMFVAELGPRECCDAMSPRVECC